MLVAPMTLGDLYDRDFFDRYGAGNPAYAAACRFIGATLAERFAPASAVDWGCGAGLHAAALIERGVNTVCVDGVQPDSDQRATGVDIRVADLRAPVPPELVPERYDLSLCIDVLEHIEDEHAGAVLANITRGAGTVVLSAAPPHQGGHHHVNEQPRRYWIERMLALDWHYDRVATGELEQHFLAHRERVPASWMYHNLCVYRPQPPPRPPGRRRRTGGRRR